MPTLQEIAQAIGGQVIGDGGVNITHACDIRQPTPDGVAFLTDSRNEKYLEPSKVSAVILDQDTNPHGVPAIRVEDPRVGFARALRYLYPAPSPDAGIHPTAIIGEETSLGEAVSIGPYSVVEDGVTIGSGSSIGAGVFIGRGSTLGENIRIFPHAVIYHNTQIGDQVTIHGGAVIGADGFGYATEKGVHHKIPQIGRVVIGSEVEIGANTTIDRGTIGDTVIGDQTKLDNLIQIAHNVKIGRGCLFAAEVGIAGSAVIGDFVTLAGQVGVADHLTVGDRVVVASKSAVMQSIPPGKFYSGIPAGDHRRRLRQDMAAKQLPEILKRVKHLEMALSRQSREFEPSTDKK